MVVTGFEVNDMRESNHRLSRSHRSSDFIPRNDSLAHLRKLRAPHWSSWLRRFVPLAVAVLLMPLDAFAQGSPWERAASNLAFTFTGPLARSLALVAIVIGGLMFMFGEGGAKRQISGIVFGGGLALFAAQFMTWLF